MNAEGNPQSFGILFLFTMNADWGPVVAAWGRCVRRKVPGALGTEALPLLLLPCLRQMRTTLCFTKGANGFVDSTLWKDLQGRKNKNKNQQTKKPLGPASPGSEWKVSQVRAQDRSAERLSHPLLSPSWGLTSTAGGPQSCHLWARACPDPCLQNLCVLGD